MRAIDGLRALILSACGAGCGLPASDRSVALAPPRTFGRAVDPAVGEITLTIPTQILGTTDRPWSSLGLPWAEQ